MSSATKTSETETMKNSATTSDMRTVFAKWDAGFKRATLCAAFGVLAAGCDKLMQQPSCPELASCDSPAPVGTWVLNATHGSCTEDIYLAPTDQRLPGGVVPAARTAPPEPALFDWCDQLVTKAYDSQTGILVQDAYIYTPDIQVGVASVSYNADGTYSAGLGRTGTFSLTFPSLCMREFGATDGNPAVDKKTGMASPNGPTNICKQLELPLGEDWKGGGAIPDVTCDVDQNPNDSGGCTCTFTANEEGGGSGTYLTHATSPSLDGHTILNLPGKDFPQKISYCNSGSELQLTGADGEYLFGTLGLRTLDLVPAPTTP
jgi:hypothetical protein